MRNARGEVWGIRFHHCNEFIEGCGDFVAGSPREKVVEEMAA